MNNFSFKKLSGNGFFELIFLVVALFASYYFCRLRFLQAEEFPSLDFLIQISSHSGPTPWQYRILIPFIADFLHQLNLPLLSSFERIYKALEAASIFLLILAFRYYITLFIKDRALNSLFSFLILFILPFHFFFPRPYYPNYWYDTPSILFFTLGLIAMYKRKWMIYYFIFIIATFNRETTCFLTVIYLLTSLGREKWGKITYHFGAQTILWFMIKGFLLKLYMNNPGASGFEWYTVPVYFPIKDVPLVSHLYDNVYFFMNIGSYPTFFSNIGFIWIPVLFYHHLIKVEFIKKSLLVVFPFFGGMMLVANIYELRIFEELIPVFLSAFALIVNELHKNTKRNSKNAQY